MSWCNQLLQLDKCEPLFSCPTGHAQVNKDVLMDTQLFTACCDSDKAPYTPCPCSMDDNGLLSIVI